MLHYYRHSVANMLQLCIKPECNLQSTVCLKVYKCMFQQHQQYEINGADFRGTARFLRITLYLELHCVLSCVNNANHTPNLGGLWEAS